MFTVLYVLAGIFLGLALLATALVLFLVLYRTPGHVFDSNGVPIYYTDEGSGVPVILVHGLGANADLNWRWPGVTKRLLNRGYRVVAMDARGHGKSGKPHDPEKYGKEMALDVLRLMDHLGIEKAHLAGYSMGGFIVIRFVTMHPERVLSAAICASGWSPLDERAIALMREIAENMRKGRLDPVIHWLDIDKRAPAAFCHVLNFLARQTNDFDAFACIFENFGGLVVDENEMKANNVPTITIVGDKDGIREFADRTGTVMGGHEIIYVPGGDHWNLPHKAGLHQNLHQHFAKHAPQA